MKTGVVPSTVRIAFRNTPRLDANNKGRGERFPVQTAMNDWSPPIGTQEPQPKQKFRAGDYVVLNYPANERRANDQKSSLHSTIWKVKGSFVQSETDPPERKYRVDPVDNMTERGVAVYDQGELIAAEEYEGQVSFHKPGGGFKYIDAFDSKSPVHQPTGVNSDSSAEHEVCPVCGSNRALYVGNEEAGIHFKQCAACGYEPHHS